MLFDILLGETHTNVIRNARKGRAFKVDLFGKPAEEWSNSDLNDAIQVYRDCEFKLNPAGPLASIANRIERNLREVVFTATEQSAQRKGQEIAQGKLAEQLTQHRETQQRKREAEERAATERQAEDALEPAKRDREVAAELRCQAEIEERQLAEAMKIAGEAERERREAEERLAKIRQQRQALEQRATGSEVGESPATQPTPAETGLGDFKVTEVHEAYNRKAHELNFNFKAKLDKCLAPDRKSVCTYHLGDFANILATGDAQTYQITDFTIGAAPEDQTQSASVLLMWTAAMALFAPEAEPRKRVEAIKELMDGVESHGDGHSRIGSVCLRLQKLEGMGIWFHVLPANTPID